MSGLKSGAVLLLLAIPLALYAAGQVNGVARTDMIADPPADRGPAREQLTAAATKAATWAAETRKAAAVVLQYRAAGPGDATSDPTAAEVVRAAAARSADLTDLDLFLSGVEGSPYTGKLRPFYVKWKDDADLARKHEQAVKDWFARPPAVASAADAVKAMDAMNDLLRQYSERSKFADRAKAENWRVRARLAVIDALAAQAETQYREAMAVKFPLKADNPKVKAADEALRGVSTQIDALKQDLENATREKIEVDADLLAAAEARKTDLAKHTAAGAELLRLFGRDDLFTDPSAVPAWLRRVEARYAETKDRASAELIRHKVQEFCEAFVPAAVRLDDRVLILGKPALRKAVKVIYREDGETKEAPLSDDPEGLNEFNVASRLPGATTFVSYGGSQEFPKDLKPTDLSKAALVYHAERKQLAGATPPRWTAKSVEALKNKCEPQKELVDQLQLPGGTGANAPQIWKRLSALADGIKGAPDLFAAQQQP